MVEQFISAQISPTECHVHLIGIHPAYLVGLYQTTFNNRDTQLNTPLPSLLCYIFRGTLMGSFATSCLTLMVRFVLVCIAHLIPVEVLWYVRHNFLLFSISNICAALCVYSAQ